MNVATAMRAWRLWRRYRRWCELRRNARPRSRPRIERKPVVETVTIPDPIVSIPFRITWVDEENQP